MDGRGAGDDKIPQRDSGPDMTIGLLKPVASLEEITGSAVFPPR
jgi:hypothetical protein